MRSNSYCFRSNTPELAPINEQLLITRNAIEKPQRKESKHNTTGGSEWRSTVHTGKRITVHTARLGRYAGLSEDEILQNLQIAAGREVQVPVAANLWRSLGRRDAYGRID